MQRVSASVLIVLLLGFPLGLCVAGACHPIVSRPVEPDWLRVLPVDKLACDGVPREFPIFAEQHDAWTVCEPQIIATVFVRCDSAPQSLTVLPSRDYLGCPLKYDSTRQRFWNSCFDWEYDRHGQVVEIPPADFPLLIPITHRIDHGQLFVSTADDHEWVRANMPTRR